MVSSNHTVDPGELVGFEFCAGDYNATLEEVCIDNMVLAPIRNSSECSCGLPQKAHHDL